ncbi:hypothetical protein CHINAEXTREME_11395 [Halobiforma lacisalsi AJ5]|uniref:DUF7344 domain-containing protein n=1 Tax=Natronobacterium lacisalsi AJ5 TaxID=358396 RepID=M0L4F2_NATLA|nr:hypothetical protein [Halobiforma lacisalsi]APW98360.1 hypothetical protein CHINAEXTREME_11395 [Halobiforma lacisalsi AJ5]EMA27963.1 hypothetical protein C445_19962 [Halobiforma lacisalsi AJ5]
MRETERASAVRTADVTPSLDRVFDLLSDRRRRYALYYLNDRGDGVATVGELTDHIAALESREDSTGGESASTGGPETESERKEGIRTELRHVHLPKLAEIGVVEHDQRSDTVRYWSQPSLEEWLEHAEHKEL